VQVAKRGACGRELHGPPLDAQRARRVQPLLIVIGSDTAPMLACTDRPDTMPP
jgi:hypothetical protein